MMEGYELILSNHHLGVHFTSITPLPQQSHCTRLSGKAPKHASDG